MSLFGDNLKAARLAKGLTLVQCANALGVTNPALSQWEQGKREPKHEMLLMLCRLLDTTPNDLLGVSSPMPASSTVVVKGNGNAVAQGVGAVAVAGDLPQCARCAHRKLAEKARRLFGPAT